MSRHEGTDSRAGPEVLAEASFTQERAWLGGSFGKSDQERVFVAEPTGQVRNPYKDGFVEVAADSPCGPEAVATKSPQKVV